jgi:parallel beta-helix repeat protein
MPKKNRKKSWKDKLAEKRIKYQRAIEAHRLKIEKKLAEKKSQKRLKSVIISVICLFVLIPGIYAAWQYVKSPGGNSQVQGNVQQQTPEAPSTVIYIWPDGRVEPSTAPIIKVGEGFYLLKGNVSLPIVVLRDNIVIDGAGLYLLGENVAGSRGVDISYRKNVTVMNLKVQGFDYGIYLQLTANTTISNCEFTKNYCGVWVSNSTRNKITSSSFTKNNYAVWLKGSSNNLVNSNVFTHSNYTLYMGFSNNNTVKANVIINNRIGLFLYTSSNNLISMNNVSKNYEGIHMLQSSYNLITLNNVIKNDIGLGSSESFNNTIRLNNFIDNVANVNVQNSTEIWDDGVSKGNYWSDFKDKYPQAVEQGEIWNMPYVIDERNKDRYPLTRKIA